MSHIFVFGSEKGGWVYPYIASLSLHVFVVGIIAILIAVSCAIVTEKHVHKHPVWMIGVWFLIGFFLQKILGGLYPYSFSQIIVSDTANAYFNTSYTHGMREFISQLHWRNANLPIHVLSNMPGKTLIYYPLHWITTSPEFMGNLIVIFSNLGALLIFVCARLLGGDRTVALRASILYYCIPAKLFFFPILNTVTPVFLLLPFVCWLQYLHTKKWIWATAFGCAMYVLFLFEPTPVICINIFVALLLAPWKENRLTHLHIVDAILVAITIFFLTHLLISFAVHVNILDSFFSILRDAIQFNPNAGRAYGIWLHQNLKEFFINTGIIQSLLWLFLSASIFWRTFGVKQKEIHMTNPFMVLTISSFLTLLLLDSTGITRGEITRLWIFMTIFPQLVTAWMTRLWKPYIFYGILSATILQSSLTIATVGFIFP